MGLLMTDQSVIILPMKPIPQENIGDQRIGRQRRKDVRAAELTAAALQLFVEKGFAATRLEDVAARASVSKATLYLYFDSKEALFKAVVQEGILPVLVEGESKLVNFQGSAPELLRDMLLAWWQMIGATHLGGIPKLMISEAANFPELAQYYHDTVITRGRNLLRNVLLRGIETGEFRPMEVDLAVELIFAPVLMLAIWRHSLSACGGEQDPLHYLNLHFDLILNGLVVPNPGKGVPPS